MRRLEVVGALLVFLAIALAIWLERPEPPDASLFGAEMALEPALPPLLAPHGELTLRGTVRTTAGAPAADAFLVLLRPEEDPSETEPVYHAYTDAEGRFHFAGLVPGSYRAVLTHPSAPPRTLPVEITASGEVEWELAAPLPPLPVLPELHRARLAGRVQWSPSAETPSPALEGFEVALVPEKETPMLAGASERRVATDAEGRFTLEELVVASYRLEVLPPWARGGTWPVLGRGSCVLRKDGDNTVELVLEVGALEGVLQEVEGRPLVGALVRVSALDARDPVGGQQLWPPVVTDALGHYQVELLPPGRYLVHLRAGAAERDVEIVVESGKRTSVPPGVMDPRAGKAAPGG